MDDQTQSIYSYDGRNSYTSTISTHSSRRKGKYMSKQKQQVIKTHHKAQ
jgi:hypothetical protein